MVFVFDKVAIPAATKSALPLVVAVFPEKDVEPEIVVVCATPAATTATPPPLSAELPVMVQVVRFSAEFAPSATPPPVPFVPAVAMLLVIDTLVKVVGDDTFDP